MKAIEKKILNKLLDKYENSKSFHGANKVEQTFAIEVAKLFPKYTDDAEYDFFIEVNECIGNLRAKDFVQVVSLKNGVIRKIVLNLKMLDEIYPAVCRTPKKEDNQWMENIWDSILKRQVNFTYKGDRQYSQMMDEYITIQKERLGNNKPVEFYDGSHEDYVDLLKAVEQVVFNEQETYIRDFSIELFGDSKRMEKLKGKVQAFLFEYGDYEEKEFVLEECGIVSTPTYVAVKGNAVLWIGSQKLDLSAMNGDIALSTESIKELSSIEVLGGRIITVENMTSFHDFPGKDDFVIYLGGFHNRIKRELIQFIYSMNPSKSYWHFGDIDAGGFYIFEHLCNRTGIPFKTLYMGIDTLKKHKASWKALTQGDRKRLEKLLDYRDRRGGGREVVESNKDVLCFMLEHNCKLEQEAVSFGLKGNRTNQLPICIENQPSFTCDIKKVYNAT